jgi:hypothetical protein
MLNSKFFNSSLFFIHSITNKINEIKKKGEKGVAILMMGWVCILVALG